MQKIINTEYSFTEAVMKEMSTIGYARILMSFSYHLKSYVYLGFGQGLH